ncbi:MAG: methenyltetrahydromethanopterin cyclohydrolase [Planctomycetales bacterium]
MLNRSLNARAYRLTEPLEARAEELRIAVRDIHDGGRIYDFGVEATGGLEAGLELARICMAGLARVNLESGLWFGSRRPVVTVATDDPVRACLFSQYAGWQLAVGKFFAMGSGPMRAAAHREELFQKLKYSETAELTVGVLEGRKLPDEHVFAAISEKTGVLRDHIRLLIAPTASLAGTLQVVARSVETALHKMLEVGFDVGQVVSGFGSAPLPPIGANDLQSIGWTNDAILYGGSVTLWVNGEIDQIRQLGPQIPACASDAYGRPFLEIFEAAGRDFYKIDPHLFSPGELILNHLPSGEIFTFGKTNADVLKKSFAG